ncbi:MAG: hypothetical protein JST80_05865 [Bdellovibrionales bacterium]|nr:hypothetical protein [Bdellovibrionales bacterium]
MEDKNIGKKTGTGSGAETEEEKKKREETEDRGTEKKKNEEIAKITITKEAESQLTELMKKVNDGFTSGRVNRQDLASWLLLKSCDEADTALVENIRAEHFDEIMMFEALLKKSKETGVLPPELQGFLKQHLGSAGRTKTRKPLT